MNRSMVGLTHRVRNYIDKGTKVALTKDIRIHIPHKKRGRYLGMSEIGKCGAYIWTKRNRPNLIPPMKVAKVFRIFRAGHIFEEEVVRLLVLGGAKVTDTQTAFIDHDDKFGGHCDGILHEPVEGRVLLEIKALNENNVAKLQTDGVAIAFPVYHAQMQLYMYYGNMVEGIFLVYCKNTSEIIVKKIKYDEEVALFHISKAEHILSCRYVKHMEEQYLGTEEDCRWCVVEKCLFRL